MTQNFLQLMAEKAPNFSKGQRGIADYIKEHYDRAAYMTASRLGEVVQEPAGQCIGFAEPALRRDKSALFGAARYLHSHGSHGATMFADMGHHAVLVPEAHALALVRNVPRRGNGKFKCRKHG